MLCMTAFYKGWNTKIYFKRHFRTATKFVNKKLLTFFFGITINTNKGDKKMFIECLSYEANSSSLSKSHEVFSEEGTKALCGSVSKLPQPQLFCDIKVHQADQRQL